VAQSGRRVRRRWLVLGIAVVVLIGIVLSALSGFYIDLLWFREVHFSGVFWSVFWSKVVLGFVFGTLFFALLTANLLIVRQLTPRFRPFSPEQEVIERYRAAIDPYARFAIPGFAALIALFVGVAAAAQWQTFLLWKSAGSVAFGASHLDPVFHRDPAFYIFRLPFLKYVQGWLFAALVGITVIVAIAHYFTGGIRIQTVGEKVTPQVKVHLSVLLGLILLVKAWGYYLGRFDLLVSARGVVTGASYTDIHAQKPALYFLAIVALVCAALFLVNIRFRGWILPVLGIGLLALISIVVGAIVPGVVQKLRVAPQELQKERPYIDLNIKATRFAFGIDISPVSASPAPDLTAAQVAANDTTVSNIRLWRPAPVLQQTYQALQRIQQYYEFKDVDVDRYPIQAQSRMVMLSVREVSQNGIPGGAAWQQAHLIYTHGYGAVASQVNAADSSGAPEFLLQNIPPVGQAIQLEATPPNDHGSQIYYGEISDVPYVVVRTQQDELNYPNPSGGGFISTKYQGSGGIPMGGFARRALFAYRYRDINLLISSLINGQSRILINRDIKTRVTKAAPFLKFDKDPYAAIVNGRIVWIWDAYTTSDLYPYSDRVQLGHATNDDLSGQVNYMRNSVKAVIDAYDGTVTYYVVDPNDPLIKVWGQAFPHLFTPVSKAPPALVAHFRYPEDLLQTQAFEFARYHVTDVPTFFNGGKRWALPAGLPETVNGNSQGTLRPYYVLIKLPTDATEQFLLFEPFTPAGRQNMVAYMTAGSDPGKYGQLNAFQFPTGENVDGPSQVRSLINQDPTVSQQLTLLSQKGSNVIFGDLLIVPIEDAFLYVQPVFVTAASAPPIPELKRVVVVHGGSVSVANSLSDAIDASFGRAPGAGGPTPGATVSDLLGLALQHFQRAQQLLQQGNLAGYQAEINAAQKAIQQADALVKGGSLTPLPSPSPSASP